MNLHISRRRLRLLLVGTSFLLLLILAIYMSTVVQTASNQSTESLVSYVEKRLPKSSEAGAMIGTIDAQGERVISLGNASFNASTLFEYGSITKVFTAILLQKLANEGAVEIEESIYSYLPTAAQREQWRSVTFKHLATHTAGIPRLPPNLNPIWSLLTGKFRDPYATYTEAKLYEGVERTAVKNTGKVWKYSNYGFSLLGNLLTKIAGEPYDQLISTEIFVPLQMETASTLQFASGDIAPPLASNGRKSSYWTLNSVAPAGAIKGSVTDALKFLRASMMACDRSDDSSANDSLANDSSDNALNALSIANCQAQQPTGLGGNEAMKQGLGWIRSRKADREIVWHNGGTGGYSSFLGFMPEQGVGVVVLINVAGVTLDPSVFDYLTNVPLVTPS